VTHDQPKHSPCWQGLKPTGRVNDAGRPIPGDPIIINCHGHGVDGLCDDCCAQLAQVLADVPRLLDDLDIAIAGESRFVEHGIRTGGTDSKASGRHPAIAAQQRLTLALIGDARPQPLGSLTRATSTRLGSSPAKPAESHTPDAQSHPGDNRPPIGAHPGVADWFDTRDPARLATQLAAKLTQLQHEPRMPNLARDISQAASRAHHVIDMPVDLCYYGPCPDCGRDIVQERIHTIIENGVRIVDPDAPPIACRFASCGYAATLDLHQRKLLEAGEDRWLTVGELVSAITSGGEIVTRHQIRHWIEKEGLPREVRSRPQWVDGELKSHEVATYRLGDVRELAQRADQKRQRMEA
jgi:hypothetical protein